MFSEYFMTQFVIGNITILLLLCVHRENFATAVFEGIPDGDGKRSYRNGENGNRLVRLIGDERTKVEVSTTIFKDFCTFLWTFMRNKTFKKQTFYWRIGQCSKVHQAM